LGFLPEIFSKNIVIPSKEIPFFGEAHQRFWAIITKFGFFGVLCTARIAKFGYSGRVTQIKPNLTIWMNSKEFG
jgi:hypothetical protein